MINSYCNDMRRGNHQEKLNNLTKFDKSQRSTFVYWWNHWKAFQYVALDLGVWRFKYVFHDWYKPWLRLVMPYEKVQKFHRHHAKHHLEWAIDHHWDGVDWVGMIVDWECSRYTKTKSQLNARETMERQIDKLGGETPLRNFMEPLLNKLGL